MKIKISDYPTFSNSLDKKETQSITMKMLKEIGELQYKMHGQNKFSLLLGIPGN